MKKGQFSTVTSIHDFLLVLSIEILHHVPIHGGGPVPIIPFPMIDCHSLYHEAPPHLNRKPGSSLLGLEKWTLHFSLFYIV
jgi:hypothetical protein